MSEPLMHLNSGSNAHSAGCGCIVSRTAGSPLTIDFHPCRAHQYDLPAFHLPADEAEVSVHCGCRLERSLIDPREARVTLCARGIAAWREANPARARSNP